MTSNQLKNAARSFALLGVLSFVAGTPSRADEAAAPAVKLVSQELSSTEEATGVSVYACVLEGKSVADTARTHASSLERMKRLGEEEAALYRSLPEDKEDAMKSLPYKLRFELIQAKMSAAYQANQGAERALKRTLKNLIKADAAAFEVTGVWALSVENETVRLQARVQVSK